MRLPFPSPRAPRGPRRARHIDPWRTGPRRRPAVARRERRLVRAFLIADIGGLWTPHGAARRFGGALRVVPRERANHHPVTTRTTSWPPGPPSTTPRQPRRRGYDAAMRSPRWRWMLVPMIVVVAGCLPGATPALPAQPTYPHPSPIESGRSRRRLPAPARLSAAQVVVAPLAQRGQNTSLDYLGSRAVPIFGLLSCPAVKECQALGIPEQPQAVWLVLYPAGSAGGHGMGWAMVDAVTGVDGMFMTHSPQN